MKNDNKPYIGVTGITCKEDVEIIKSSLGDLYGMYGVLVSYTTLRTELSHRGRYPNIENLKEIFEVMPENALRTIHYNTRYAENLSRDIEEIIGLTNGLCNCVQLNVEYPPLSQVIDIKEKNKDLKIIFQLGKESLKIGNRGIVSRMEPYIQYIDYILIDASGGAGIEMKIMGTYDFAKPLRNLKSLTFAGGLDGFSIFKFITMIEHFNASIDAEGKLLNDDDKLDHEKVVNYIRAAKTIRWNKLENEFVDN